VRASLQPVRSLLQSKHVDGPTTSEPDRVEEEDQDIVLVCANKVPFARMQTDSCITNELVLADTRDYQFGMLIRYRFGFGFSSKGQTKENGILD
jgi:hypothetical protein